MSKRGGIEMVKDNKLMKQKEVKSKEQSLSVEDAISGIRKYYADTIKDSRGRYQSWIHCYSAFKNNRNNRDEKTVDYLALQLAFYLASWGMYRGSSFLLQKDYKVHIPVVEIVLSEKYTPLLGVTAEDIMDDNKLDLLMDVSKKIREAYANEQASFENRKNNATDTLVTKILLGTLGCVPAYDRYYIQAAKQYNISAGVYNKKSVKDVATYYLKYKEEFEKVREELSSQGIEYPVMKIMDMCLWQVGFDA